MTMQINGTSGLVFNDASTQNTAATGFGFKNRILNGQMVLDQRNAGASVTAPAGTTTYFTDRWSALELTDGSATLQQVTDAPTGFSNSLKLTVTGTDSSLTTTQQMIIQQRIEGFNTADLMFGTANAQTVTLSFQVKSSVTGTFSGSLRNSANDRSYPFTYTISSANTWEQKSVTIAGDTSGTWIGATNGIGLEVIFSLGAGADRTGTAGAWASASYVSATGSTNLMATSGATFYLTGVQLEKGSTATSFDYRPYGTELNLCQRYCYVDGYTGNAYTRFPLGYATSTTVTLTVLNFPITMRTVPSLTWNGAFAEVFNSGGGATGTSVAITSDGNSASHAAVSFTYSSGSVGSNSINAIRINNSTSWYARFEAEL